MVLTRFVGIRRLLPKVIDVPDTSTTLSLTLASIVFDTDIDITSDFTLAAELVTTHGNGYEFYYAFHCMPFVGTSRLRLP